MSDKARAPLYRETRLENGLTVVTEAMPHVATVSLGVWVGAGSRHERADEHGLSHLIEHMAFKGTARRSAKAIAEDIENVGGDINAATGAEYTCYTARMLGEDCDLALDVLCDILTEATFAEEELVRERGVILQEIAAVEDNPEDLVGDLFLEAAYPDAALGRPILGRPETVSAFTPDTIRAYLAREYRPARMVIAAAGAVEHERVVDAAHRFFGAWTNADAPEAAPAPYRGGEVRRARKHEQTIVMIGLPGSSFRARDYYATQLFTQALGGSLSSRLWQEVREIRGLAYNVDAFHWAFSDTGLFGIEAGVAPKDARAFVDVALETLEAAASELTPVELARAKAQVKVSLLATLETPAGRTERLARQILGFDRIIPAHDLVARLDAVSLDEVRAAGCALMAGPPTLAAIGPMGKLQSSAEIAGRLTRR